MTTSIEERIRNLKAFKGERKRNNIFVVVADAGNSLRVHQEGIAGNPAKALRGYSKANLQALYRGESVWSGYIQLLPTEFMLSAWVAPNAVVHGDVLYAAAICDRRLNIRKGLIFTDLARAASAYAEATGISVYQSLTTKDAIARNVRIKLLEKLPC